MGYALPREEPPDPRRSTLPQTRLSPIPNIQLLDVNGDGLPDLVRGLRNERNGLLRVEVAYNRGHGFTQERTTILEGVPIPEVMGVDNSNCVYPHTKLLRNVDNDGLLDFVCMDPVACNFGPFGQPPQPHMGVAFSHGGGFYRFSHGADRVGGTIRTYTGQHLQRVGPGDVLATMQDYVDLDGDGVAETYHWAEREFVLDLDKWSAPNDTAPGLITQIDNGIGGIVRFRYARSTDAATVSVSKDEDTPEYAKRWSDWIRPSMPFHVWVVKAVDVSADQGKTFARTRYQYADPVFTPDDLQFDQQGAVKAGPGRRFRGFQGVTSFLATMGKKIAPKVFERYTYVQDPDGRVDYRALYDYKVEGPPGKGREGYQKLTLDQYFYSVRQYLGNVRFVALDKEHHADCVPSWFESNCDRQRAIVKEVHYTYEPYRPTKPQVLLWLGTESTEAVTTDHGGDLGRSSSVAQRLKSTEYLVLDRQSDYLVLPKRQVERLPPETLDKGIGGIPDPDAYSREIFYDGSRDLEHCGNAFGSCKGALTAKRVYRDPRYVVTGEACPNEEICVEYGAWFEGTGNRTRIVRPSAMQKSRNAPDASSTPATIFGFALPYRLFSRTETNELGHVVTRIFDLATGDKLVELGPNSKRRPCPGESSIATRSKLKFLNTTA